MKYQILNGLSAEYIESLKARFWAKVDTSGGPDACWEWTAALNSKGYGCIGINRRSQLSHRVSFELFNGPIPAGQLVCHSCDNPSCVNPVHLFVGTNSDNVNDAIEKGRSGSTKLDPAAVRHLRNSFDPQRHTVAMWANELDVNQRTVATALRGMTHKGVGGRIRPGSLMKTIDSAQFDKVKRLYGKGLSGLQIAQRLNISKSSVYRILKDQQRVIAD